jgi:hypothetical protein
MLQEPLTLELDHLRFKKVGSVAQTTNVQYVLAALQDLGGTANSKKALKDKVMEIYSSKNKGKTIAHTTAASYIEQAVAVGDIKETPIAKSKNKQYTL